MNGAEVCSMASSAATLLPRSSRNILRRCLTMAARSGGVATRIVIALARGAETPAIWRGCQQLNEKWLLENQHGRGDDGCPKAAFIAHGRLGDVGGPHDLVG